MNREIKFRAIVPVNSDGPKSMQYFDLSKIDDCSRIAYADYDANALMQYVGFCDKNGRDIYEGDILNGRNQVLKIVYWCEKRAAFCESEQFKPVPAKHSFAKLYDKFKSHFNHNGSLINHEVVGNIYENPELLNP